MDGGAWIGQERLEIPEGELRLLSAREVLDARREGDALAGDGGGRALCRNACLLARALEREGRPVFDSGRAVLAGLRVEDIARLADAWGAWNREMDPAPPERKGPAVDWAAAVLGEEETRPAPDGAGEASRLAPARMDRAERKEQAEKLPDAGLDGWTDELPERGGETDWAEVRADGDGVEWMAEAEPGTGRTVWTLGTAERGRTAGGGPEAVETDSGALPGMSREAGTAREKLPGVDWDGGTGSAELHRGAAEGARAPAPLPVPEPVSRMALEREGGSPPGLTVEELDRAVRRDSRRYDGGMSIF